VKLDPVTVSTAVCKLSAKLSAKLSELEIIFDPLNKYQYNGGIRGSNSMLRQPARNRICRSIAPGKRQTQSIELTKLQLLQLSFAQLQMTGKSVPA
jgi:hypothetical protein